MERPETSSPENSAYARFRSVSDEYASEIEAFLSEFIPSEPYSLYDPVRYILSAGGKRVRPILTALAAFAVHPGHSPNWIPGGAAIELLHTFTLVHDDIMDNAETRRGKPSVHVAFGRDAAILSGDVIIALATEALSKHQGEHTKEMLHEFALGFIRVCEGQALDKAFENRHDIAHEDYLMMIRLKTASIFELAATLGAYAGGGLYVEEMRLFARHTGLAFQMLDDLLDLTAMNVAFGKTIGGDILEGKRTFLFVEAMQHYPSMTVEERALMDRIASHAANADDILLAQHLFERIGVIERTRKMIAQETTIAQDALMRLPESQNRDSLVEFSKFLLARAT